MWRHVLVSAEGALRGRELEDLVEQRLKRLVEKGFLQSYLRHTNNEREDQQGFDFTITANTPSGIKTAKFGVTISRKRHANHRRRRPKVIQFLFPFGTPVYDIDRQLLQLASRL